MAEQKFPKGSVEWDMFQQFWRLCQKYWIVEDAEEYWDALVKDASDFMDKYDTFFARQLVAGFVENQDKKWRDGINQKTNVQ